MAEGSGWLSEGSGSVRPRLGVARKTKPLIVLAKFGKFGRTVLSQLGATPSRPVVVTCPSPQRFHRWGLQTVLGTSLGGAVAPTPDGKQDPPASLHHLWGSRCLRAENRSLQEPRGGSGRITSVRKRGRAADSSEVPRWPGNAVCVSRGERCGRGGFLTPRPPNLTHNGV